LRESQVFRLEFRHLTILSGMSGGYRQLRLGPILACSLANHRVVHQRNLAARSIHSRLVNRKPRCVRNNIAQFDAKLGGRRGLDADGNSMLLFLLTELPQIIFDSLNLRI